MQGKPKEMPDFWGNLQTPDELWYTDKIGESVLSKDMCAI